MSTNTAPLFDMSKAVPVQGNAPQQAKPLFDMSKALPVQGSSAPQQPAPSLEQQLTANPDKQGLYRFVDMSKAPQNASDQEFAQWTKKAPVIYVPYSKALALLGNPEHYRGLDSGEPASDWERLQQHIQTQIDMATNPMQPIDGTGRQYVLHPDEVQHLFQSYQHDPNRAAMRRGEFLSSLPPLQTAIGAARSAAGTATFGGKVGPQGARQFAKSPQKNAFQAFGGGAETKGEFMTGEQLVAALPRVLGYTPKLAEIADIEEEMRKGTPAGELLKQALTGGVTAGAQTYARTGGDVGAAVQSGVGMGVLGAGGAALAGTVEGVKAATAARAAEEARAALDAKSSFANEVENYNWKKAKYDYDIEKRNWDKQVETIDAQHEQNVAAEQAKHDQEVARITAAHPQQVEAQRAAHNQNIANLEAQHQANLKTAEAAHNQRLANWNRQYQNTIETARTEHEAAEQAKVTASQEARTAAQKDYEQRQTAAQQKAQTAAQAEQQRLTTEAEAAQQAETKATAQRYGETARGAVEPQLRAIEEAGQRPITMAQPGGAPGVVVGHAPLVRFDVNESLGRIGDYTGARAELRTGLNQANEAMDDATNGRFTQLRDEVSAAQSRVYANESAENVAAYKSKLGEMDDLLASTKGRVTPQLRDAVRQGWRQYYVLGDVANGLDKSVMGVPGGSAASQIYRGTDGKTLTNELKNAVIKHGRPAVEAALGGPDRLSTLEDIGRQTMTNGGRQKLNQAVVDVSKYLEPVEEPNLPPEYKKAPFVKPAPETPKPKFEKPAEPEGMRAKFKEPKIEDVWGRRLPNGEWEPFSTEFQEPEHPGYPPKPEPPAPRPPKEPVPPTPPTEKHPLGVAAKWVLKKTIGAAAFSLGYTHGGYTGGALAKGAAESGMNISSAAVQKVQSAMMSDPKVAKFLLFVARNGGDAKLYGPAIANMIVNNQQEQQGEQDNANQTR